MLLTHGDDVDLELPTLASAHMLLEKINSFGFEVAPQKTMIGSNILPNSEFLKTFFYCNNVLAYSSRLVAGMVH